MARRLALPALLLLAASCAQGTYVTLTVESQGPPLSGLSRVDLDLELAGQHASARLGGSSLSLPTTAVLEIAHGAGPLTIRANALAGSVIVAQTTAVATVERGKHTAATVTFGAAVSDMLGSDGGCAVCDPRASCSLSGGSVSCTCPSGYTGDGTICTSIDYCGTDLGHCDVNATCSNVPGFYACSCNAGFVGTGTSCSPLWVQALTQPGTFVNSGGAFTGGGDVLYFSAHVSNAAATLLAWNVNSGAAGSVTAQPADPGGQLSYGTQFKLLSSGSRVFILDSSGEWIGSADTMWTTLSPWSGSYQMEEAVLGSDAYLISSPNVVQAFNLSTLSFESGTVAVYPIATSGAAIASVGGKLYVLGGQTVASANTLAGYVYDPVKNAWSPVAPAPETWFYPDAVGFRGKIWVLLPGSGDNGHLQIYDPSDDSWQPQTLTLPAGGANWHLAVAGVGTPGLYLLGDFPPGLVIYKYNQ